MSRYVAARIDLFHAHHRGDIGDAPSVDVEHRGDRQIHIVAANALSAPCQRCHHAEGMQHQLPVAEIHALGQAGGAGGVERGGAGVFREIRERVIGIAGGQQRFVLGVNV